MIKVTWKVFYIHEAMKGGRNERYSYSVAGGRVVGTRGWGGDGSAGNHPLAVLPSAQNVTCRLSLPLSKQWSEGSYLRKGEQWTRIRLLLLLQTADNLGVQTLGNIST